MRRIQLNPPKNFYVYIWFRPDGIPCYVGKGQGNRWLRTRPHNRHLKNIIVKAKREGKDIPKIKVRVGLTEAEAFDTEVAFIAAIGRCKNGGPLVNFTDGGEGVSNPPASVRAKIRKATKQRMSDPNNRNNIGIKNRVHMSDPEKRAKFIVAVKEGMARPEVRLLLSKKATGRILTPEHCNKISIKAIERMADPNVRAEMSERSRGKIPDSKTRKKMSKSHLLYWDQRRKSGLPMSRPAKDEEKRREAIRIGMLLFRQQQKQTQGSNENPNRKAGIQEGG